MSLVRQKIKNFGLYGLVLIVLLCSCCETALEQALRLAGDNRQELEYVLDHYARHPGDSLKWRAACFLIENMPGHATGYSYTTERCRQMNSYPFFTRKTLDICLGVYEQEDLEKIEDITTIKADFLIQHIDSAYAQFQRYPWTRDLPFDMFLDYILPYRLEYEQLDLWRDSFHITSNSIKNYLRREERKYEVFASILKFQEPAGYPGYMHYSELVGQNLHMDCRYMFLAEVFHARALGLPCALDFIPYYPNRNGYHYWRKLLSGFRKNTTIYGAPASKAAKVYRRTYAHNFSLRPGHGEYVPSFFCDPFNRDVTDEYFQTETIRVRAEWNMPARLRYGYLCVFNNLNWCPIARGEHNGEDVVFDNMGKDILYLPTFFVGEEMCAMNWPFVLRQNGLMEQLVPDTLHTIDLRLYRKYPYTARTDFSDSFQGVIVQGDQDSLFTNPENLCMLEQQWNEYYIERTWESPKAYRYWRILSAHAVRHIADLYFWDDIGNRISATTLPSTQACLDGDPLTCPASPENSLIIDFGKPISIRRMICLPRNDGNGIYPDNVYELYYYGRKGWKSLGRKTAKDFFLEYEKVPMGALYWLRNLTQGVEERVFVLENGEIRFW